MDSETTQDAIEHQKLLQRAPSVFAKDRTNVAALSSDDTAAN